jgi:hypothetical protein
MMMDSASIRIFVAPHHRIKAMHAIEWKLILFGIGYRYKTAHPRDRADQSARARHRPRRGFSIYLFSLSIQMLKDGKCSRKQRYEVSIDGIYQTPAIYTFSFLRGGSAVPRRQFPNRWYDDGNRASVRLFWISPNSRNVLSIKALRVCKQLPVDLLPLLSDYWPRKIKGTNTFLSFPLGMSVTSFSFVKTMLGSERVEQEARHHVRPL